MKTYLLRLNLYGSLLVGGQVSSLLVDTATARYTSGVPYIPASAVKGSLRIEFERLARHVYPDVCSPDTSSGCQGKKCLACSVFGSPCNEGKLRFYDAVLDETLQPLFQKRADEARSFQSTGRGYSVRTGVTISRKRKVAEDKLLYDAEVLIPFLPACGFLTRVDAREALTEDEEKFFRAAIKTLRGIGRSKSRGLGRIEAVIEEEKEFDLPAAPGSGRFEQAACLHLTLVPRENILVGGLKTQNNFLDGQDYITGANVRGAVAAGFAASLPGKWEDGDFRQAFLSEPALFSDFYPAAAGHNSLPVPFSARTCKAFPGLRKGEGSHGTRDILIAASLVKLLRQCGVTVVLEDSCHCGMALRGISGYYCTGGSDAKTGPGSILSTKTAINRKRWQSAEGKLYTLQLMNAGQDYDEVVRLCFTGTVTGATPALNKYLESLEGKELFIGGARSRGFGRVQVQVTPFDAALCPSDIKVAKERFSSIIRNCLQDMGIDSLRGYKLADLAFFSLTLQSDLLLPPGDLKEELLRELSFKLGVSDLYLEKAIVRTGFRGGYNSAIAIRKELAPVIRAGSAFVFSVPLGALSDEVYVSAVDLERNGLGCQREEGFGRVVFCDSFHIDRINQK